MIVGLQSCDFRLRMEHWSKKTTCLRNQELVVPMHLLENKDDSTT